MLVKTKYFGDINLNEENVITFEQGIMGFEEYKTYTILYDVEEDKDVIISWLQSVEMPELAIPIISPSLVKPDYNPNVEDELLSSIAPIQEESLVVFSTLTVPKDIANMTVNLKAPIIINSQAKKGCQIILEQPEYEVKCKVYDIIKTLKSKKGE